MRILVLLSCLAMTGCVGLIERATFLPWRAGDAALVHDRAVADGAAAWQTYQLAAVDDKLVSPLGGRSGDEPAKVPPGERALTVLATVQRGPGKGPLEAYLPLRARLEPGASYRLNGRVEGARVEVWLEQVETGRHASEPAAAPLYNYAQATPLPVFVPLR
ncbi:MAG TPA: hypothetical protein VM489_15065 [Burkholderiales bacterium]|nr:hypothetical protein [Burkholderiales bacterium]